MLQKEDRDYDVIIIGSGLAGHCAALEASGTGIRVLMVDAEKTPGGSSRMSTGIIMGAGTRFQRAHGYEDSADRLYSQYMSANQWRLQPSVVYRLCVEAGPAIEWLNDLGVEIADQFVWAGEEDAPRGHVTRGGADIIQVLAGRLSGKTEVDVVLGNRVDRLVVRDGAVVGIGVGEDMVTAGAVVIASGGMAANPELLRLYQPDTIEEANGPLHHQETPWARGDAIQLARQVGAQILSGRGSRSPMWSFGGGYLPSFTIVVNQFGRRFMKETASYAATEMAIVQQPSATAYMLFDDAIKQQLKTPADVSRYMKVVLPETEYILASWTSKSLDDLVAQGAVIKADTLEMLAQRIGVPGDNLAGTVDRYNTFAALGYDADYYKREEGVLPIATAPYYAVQIKLNLLGLSATGMRIDHEARVIHENSRSIPGLFAAGECVGGVLGSVYFGSGNSLANCTVFGRIAGRNAATYAATGECPETAPRPPEGSSAAR